jgi:hypothetical protein
MKQTRYFWIGAAALIALGPLIAVAFLITPTSVAQLSSSPPVSSTANGTPSSSGDYLIALPISLPNSDEIPRGLTPEQAADYGRSLTYRQARPILAELDRLQAEGSIAGFEVRADLHGVVVEGGTLEALERVSRLPGVAAVLSLEDELPTCAIAAAEALPEQVLRLSRMAADATPSLRMGSLAAQATDPSIHVYAPSGSGQGHVRGQTMSASTTVTMRILRHGQVVANRSTWSDSSGSYMFFPSWQDCPASGYEWTLQPGDVVEVTVGSNAVSTVVVSLSAWVDPDANTVAGQTDPGRSAEVWLYDYGVDPCSSFAFSQTVPTGGSGGFGVDLSSQVDFDRRAYSTIYALDTSGNSTYASFYAYRMRVSFDDDFFGGYLKPEVDFTATLSRTGSIISTDSGRSSASGYYYGYFTDTIQAGDVVQVNGGGVSMQYIVTSLDVTLDHTTDQATGTTGAGRLVRASFYKASQSWWGYGSGRWYPDFATTCSWGSDCGSTVADGGGGFTVDTTLDLARGDYADVYVYDADWNYQYVYDHHVPAIIANPMESEFSGYWGDPNAGYVTVIIKSSGGTVKHTDSWVWVDSWDGGFSDSTWTAIAPTDIIEVTDGTVTETMTVQTLTGRLDGGAGRLSGSAYNGHLVARLEDFRREYGEYWPYCAEIDVTGGTYDLTFGGAQVGGQDDVYIWNTGPDGHYTYRHVYAFTVNAEKGGDYVGGYSETPGVPVTVTLQRSGSPIAVYTTTSDSDDGYYGANLGDGTPVVITQGDTVMVWTGDGDSVSLPVPELTANADGASNRIYGRSPADEPVRTEPRRIYSYYGSYSSVSQSTTADGSGNYSTSFDGVYWDRDCSNVDTGDHCIQPVVYYYNAAGHQVWLEGPYPQPVGPDIYESDNISTTASTYAGFQSHTFHTISDTDWVTFTVPAVDITTPVSYRIETFNLGWRMATRLDLYDTDGTTLLDSWTGYEYHGRGISVLWTPLAAGTYYLEVSPPYSSYAAYCDAAYDLMILPVRAQVYLPLVAREY